MYSGCDAYEDRPWTFYRVKLGKNFVDVVFLQKN